MTRDTRLSLCGAVAAILAMAGLVSACRADDPAMPPQTTPLPDRAWVQLTGRGAEVRLITAAAQCPSVTIDGAATPMQVRAGPTAEFPATICQLALPATAANASLGGHALPLPKAKPHRILIFGDTGCRLKGMAIQDCNDARAWPFALVSQKAAAHRPDLVIHVGDYYYRENACPAGHTGCSGSPWGDNAVTWDAEFFAPTAPLLAAAPWVMVRGNHEDCKRGGPGWFRLLDADPKPLACPSMAAPYAVNIGGLNLYILDSADTEDRGTPPEAVAQFSGQLDALKDQLKTKPGWIITHRPVWGYAPVARLGSLGPLEIALNLTEQAAVKGHDLSAVTMIVSGHIHHFASFDFGAQRPAQLIAGTGGDIGETGDVKTLRANHVDIDDMGAQMTAFARYGFLILDRTGADWAGAFYDLDDKVVARCRLHGRDLTCQAANH